jgi:cell division septal protein FtsQ
MGRLALAQPRSVRAAIAVPWRNVAAVVLGSCAVLALLYLAARETPVFAVRTIEVSGGPKTVRADVEEAARPFLGESLAALDGAALTEELEALPSVRSVTYDRAFPSTLRIFVERERPAALARVGRDRWIVSDRGRVISAAAEGAQPMLPRFHLPPLSGIQPGRFLTDPQARAILAAVVQLPDRFPARVTAVVLGERDLTMALRTEWGEPELRLGDAVDIALKLEVAGLVLRSLSPEERLTTAYLDVSVPERAVVGSTLDSQVEP